jgi:hypothetical protein
MGNDDRKELDSMMHGMEWLQPNDMVESKIPAPCLHIYEGGETINYVKIILIHVTKNGSKSTLSLSLLTCPALLFWAGPASHLHRTGDRPHQIPSNAWVPWVDIRTT